MMMMMMTTEGDDDDDDDDDDEEEEEDDDGKSTCGPGQENNITMKNMERITENKFDFIRLKVNFQMTFHIRM